MNFSELSFWWLLALSAGTVLTIRQILVVTDRPIAKYDRLALAVVSLTLFFNASKESFWIFLLTFLVNFAAVRFMDRNSAAKAIAAITIAFNVATLCYFKYFGLVAEAVTAGQISQQDAMHLWFAPPERIPPGISFYTFQKIAFIADAARRNDRLRVSFLDYLNFSSFFPLIVAGPIERKGTLYPQLVHYTARFTLAHFDLGMRWISVGLFFKLCLGNNLAPYAFSEIPQNAWMLWAGTALFGLRIYFDFAGYSFIALGLARLLGIDLTLNFRAPYTATNIQDFWHRWHVSLSRWFRDYLYIPMGGGRVRWASANIFLVFLVSGLWHGAHWNYAMWGAYHGVLMLLHRLMPQKLHLPPSIGWFLTMASVVLGWLVFRETDSSRLVESLRVLTDPHAYSLGDLKEALSLQWLRDHRGAQDRFGTIALIFLCCLVLLAERQEKQEVTSSPYRLLLHPWTSRFALALALLLGHAESEFIYFAF